MSDKLCRIAVQYLRELAVKPVVRAYENKSPISASLDVVILEEALPEPLHHRVELKVTIMGVNAEQVHCYSAVAHYEAIVIYENLDEHERDAMMTMHIPGLLVGQIRADLANAMANTGYTKVTLPPLTGAQLKQIAAKSANR